MARDADNSAVGSKRERLKEEEVEDDGCVKKARRWVWLCWMMCKCIELFILVYLQRGQSRTAVMKFDVAQLLQCLACSCMIFCCVLINCNGEDDY